MTDARTGLLTELMNDDADNEKAEQPDQAMELLPPEGVAVYPGDRQAVSSPDAKDPDENNSTVELKPSSVVVTDPKEVVADPKEAVPRPERE